MLHPGIAGDRRQAAQHELLLATRLIGGGVALAAFPAYLALWGAPTIAGAILFAWLMTPLGVALYLSRSGRLERAQILSALSLAGLVAYVAALTGGPLSPLLAWILVVPAEAALWGSRRVIAAATGFAAAAMAALSAAAYAGVLPHESLLTGAPWALPALGVLPAALYLGILAAAAGREVDDDGNGERSFRTLVEQSHDVITRHRRNGNLTYVSPAAARQFGLPAGELLADGLFRRIHVQDRPVYLRALDQAALEGLAAAVLRLKSEGGDQPDWLWVEMRCRAPRGESDIVGVLRDVTAIKAQEKNLAEACEQAERKSLAKTRFLARVSHELRTPLNAIIGFSELLAQPPQDGLDKAKQREYAELICDSGRHLLDLINDILDMSKIETGSFTITPEPFDLAALIENCRQLLGPQVSAAGLSLDADLPVDLPELVADRRSCKQILLNLLHNAVKFSRPGGRIVVGAYREGDATCFYVADEGIGIDSDDISRLGQPFVQLQSSYDRNYEGAGLGLSVVKGLVSLHGGELVIDSTFGVGTRVTVRLQAVSGPTAGETCPDEPMRMSA